MINEDASTKKKRIQKPFKLSTITYKISNSISLCEWKMKLISIHIYQLNFIDRCGQRNKNIDYQPKSYFNSIYIPSLLYHTKINHKNKNKNNKNNNFIYR